MSKKKQVVKPDGTVIPASVEGVSENQNATTFVDDDLADVVALRLPGGYAERQANRPAVLSIDTTDSAADAAEQLSTFDLSPGARSLLTRAIDNAISNKGIGLQDPDARLGAEVRSELLEAADGDLSIALDALATTVGAERIASEVYSLLYNILKSATFIANIDYRRALDPTSDFDLNLYTPIISHGEDGADKYDKDFVQFLVDRREDESPMEGQAGHPTRHEWLFEQMQALYGNAFQNIEDAVVCSLRDLQLFFQLTVESFGWDPNRPMPYLYVAEDVSKGIFTPITDADVALDTQEIKRQAARAKRRDSMNQLRLVAAKAAQAKVAEVLAKRSVQ